MIYCSVQTGLKELDLSKNNLADGDCSWLIELIKKNLPNLRVLVLRDNLLREAFGDEIVNAMK